MGTVGGDQADQEFDQLFLANFSRVREISARIVGDRAVAEEIAAEAFARAYARWSKVRRYDNPVAWVVRTASNASIDVLRRRRADLPEVPVDQETATRLVEIRASLVPALRSLPRRQRQVVVLRYVADLTDDQVAEVLGVSAGTVKVHLHRALPALRRRLEDGPDLEEAG
jgi:RNA polymerase sigma-70 factor (ECF subfamily)